jgi:hypothetical protein
MALEPRIEAVRAKYDLAHDDFWKIKQNGQWVCKHAALEIVAVKAGIKWHPPQIIESDAPNLVTSMVVTGQMGDRTEWATGETNATNYKVTGKQSAYPWAMSEKRAKDRVVLKLVGIHGLVYSEDEADDFKQPTQPEPRQEQTAANDVAPAKRISAAHQKRQLDQVKQDLVDATTVDRARTVFKIWREIAQRDGWDKGYWEAAANLINARAQELKAAEEDTVSNIQQQFGGKVVNEHVREQSFLEAGQ